MQHGISFNKGGNLISVTSVNAISSSDSGLSASVNDDGSTNLSGTASADTTITLSASANLTGNAYMASLQDQSGTASETITAKFIAAVQAAQAVDNGDFSTSSDNLATGSTATGMSGVSCAQGAQVLIATTQWGHWGFENILQSGHRYYIRAKVKASSSSVQLVSNTDSSGGFSSANHSGGGDFENLSFIVDIASGYTGDVRVQDNTSSDWADITVEYIMAIDMGTSGDSYYSISATNMAALFPDYFDSLSFPVLASISVGASESIDYGLAVGSVQLTIPSGTVLTDYVIGLQIEAGSSSSAWEPYGVHGVIFYPPTGETGTLTNPGNADAYPVITITGPCSDPSISNQTTGESIACDIALGRGDTLVIDCRPETRGCYLNSALQFGIKQGLGWIHCPPGDNVLSFSRIGYDTKRHCTISLQGAYL